jgi:hypothetical protein
MPTTTITNVEARIRYLGSTFLVICGYRRKRSGHFDLTVPVAYAMCVFICSLFFVLSQVPCGRPDMRHNYYCSLALQQKCIAGLCCFRCRLAAIWRDWSIVPNNQSVIRASARLVCAMHWHYSDIISNVSFIGICPATTRVDQTECQLWPRRR